MQIVIVEDRPWKLEKSISQMHDRGMTVSDMVYVCTNKADIETEVKKKLQAIKDKFEGLRIKETDDEHFIEDMQKYYDDERYFILCDFNLTGGRREFFEKRINIMFIRTIMEKKSLKEPPARIVFYTTAGESANEQINQAFPGHNISVEKIDEDQVILDIEEIVRAVKESEKNR